MTGGALITTTENGDRPKPRPGAHYLAWSRAGRPTLPRYVIGLVVILAGWIAGTLAVQLVLTAVGGGTAPTPTTPAGQLATVLATFTLAVVAVPWAVRTVLRRPGWTVATGTRPGPLRHFALGAAISLTVALAVDLLLTPSPRSTSPGWTRPRGCRWPPSPASGS